MEKQTPRTLIYFEKLTLPSFQVIVLTANTGCASCRRRVSQLISKMTRLTEYTVDVRNKQVVIKGDVRHHQNAKNDDLRCKQRKERHPLQCCFRFSRASCGGKYLAD
ncbi:hypothetical protein L1049_007230 [Liquidambar formosana]|uniref:HMA domain-containing protein n=1 Tax=Liquidambar formosana TaxID=63359 RepID=A0AAP0RIE5_LIQFO